MKHTVGQKGFSVVEVVVVLAMVAVLAVGGFFVWQKNKDDSAKKSDAKTSQSEEEPSDPSEGGKYLVIEEWAIKLPLNDDIAEAYYTFSSDDLADHVSLYDAAFDSLKNADDASCGDSPYLFYAISRIKQENVATLNSSEGPGQQYREFPFTKEYAFSGLGAHQAPPECAHLSPSASGEVREDENIFNIADVKERAFDSAFMGLRSSK